MSLSVYLRDTHLNGWHIIILSHFYILHRLSGIHILKQKMERWENHWGLTEDFASYLYPRGNCELSLLGIITIKLNCFSWNSIFKNLHWKYKVKRSRKLSYISQLQAQTGDQKVLSTILIENIVYFYSRQNFFLQFSFYRH